MFKVCSWVSTRQDLVSCWIEKYKWLELWVKLRQGAGATDDYNNAVTLSRKPSKYALNIDLKSTENLVLKFGFSQ